MDQKTHKIPCRKQVNPTIFRIDVWKKLGKFSIHGSYGIARVCLSNSHIFLGVTKRGTEKFPTSCSNSSLTVGSRCWFLRRVSSMIHDSIILSSARKWWNFGWIFGSFFFVKVFRCEKYGWKQQDLISKDSKTQTLKASFPQEGQTFAWIRRRSKIYLPNTKMSVWRCWFAHLSPELAWLVQ